MDTVKDQTERLWYLQQTIEYGWSRNILVHQIESKLYHRQGKATTNFNLNHNQKSELAQQLLKDPYTFDFLNLGEDFLERDLERALINHIRDFLLEFGWVTQLIKKRSLHKIKVRSLFYHSSGVGNMSALKI